MKKTMLILLVFFLSITLNSAQSQQNLTLENSSNVELFTVYHRVETGLGTEYIKLELPLQAFLIHILHGDRTYGHCEPPACG